MKENDTQFKLVLAAMLHDIGKFRQRCGLELKDYDWQVCCPESNGYRHHLHAGHTGQFLADYCNKEDQAFFDLASFHHLSLENGKNVINNSEDLPFYAIIKKADHLASGHERENLKEKIDNFDRILLENTLDKSNFEDKQQQDYIRARLESIFQQVKVEHETKSMVYPIKELSETICPVQNEELDKNEAMKQYGKHWDKFENEFKNVYKRIANDDYSHQILSYLSLLEKYTWCIPSSAYKNTPNVSLYDHLRLTASIADALYVYHNNKATLEPKDILTFHNEARFRLIQGDFSGIQNFIFSKAGESNKNAAKILRARSFLVSLATELTAKKICDKLGITVASIIMNAGGKFTILAPNLDNIDDLVQAVIKEVNEDFEKRTIGQTKMFVTSVELKEEDFSDVENVFKQLNNKLNTEKHRPAIKTEAFTDYLKDDKNDICSVCGWHSVNNESQETKVCNYCKEYEELGKDLIKANYLVLSEQKDNNSDNFLGYAYKVFSSFENNHKIAKELENKSLVFAFNSDDTLENTKKLEVVLPVKRITTNLPTINKEEIKIKDKKYNSIEKKDKITEKDFENKSEVPKTFEYLACDALEIIKENENESIRGKAFLGILKADIDNLGYIFAKGFKKTNFSLITSLSRMIDYFFSGWLLDKIKTDYKNIYTVFAGGDDLFLIGPYTDVFKIGKDINEHLQQYTGNHKDFHLSMGIALSKPMIPVYQLNDMAEEQLAKSKNYKNNKEKTVKNAFSMFHQTVSWDNHEELMKINKEIERIETEYKKELPNEGISTQYLYRILKFADMKENIYKNERNKMWEPLLHYITAKNYKNEKDKDGKELDIGLKNELLKFSEYIDKWGNKLIIPLSMKIYKERE